MPLEDRIEELTAAVIALTEVIESAGAGTQSEPEPEKPAPRRRRKKAEPKDEAAPKPSRRSRKPKKEPEPGPEPEDNNGDVGLPEIRKKFRELVKVAGRDGAVEVLSEFGAKTVPELEEDDYADVAAAIDEAIEDANADD